MSDMTTNRIFDVHRNHRLFPKFSPFSLETTKLWLVYALLAIPAFWLLIRAQLSILTCLLALMAVSVIWMLNRGAAIISVLLFVMLLGDIRRLVDLYAGIPRLDPLLTAAPFFALCVAIPILLSTKLRNPLSRAVMGLTVIMALAIFNPRQGSIVVGLSGAFFFLIPLCWFWVANRYASDRIMFLVIYRVIIPIGVLAATLGIYQTYIGFLPWEQVWIKHALEIGFAALRLGNGHIRSFGFSSNSAEYGAILTLASASIVAAFFAGRRSYSFLLPLLLTAQVLASERGALLRLLLSIVVIWAVRGKDMRTWLPRVFIGGLVGISVLLYSAKQVSSGSGRTGAKTSTADAATSHLTQGFAHPLEKRYSTVGIHSTLITEGFANGFKYPLGSGLGIVTLGAGKFGGNVGISGTSELDFSDVFITTGIIGGFLYVFTVGAGFWAAAMYIRKGPAYLSFPLIGIMTCLLGAWMPLGQYAIGPLLWFCVGFLARKRDESRSPATAALRSQKNLESGISVGTLA